MTRGGWNATAGWEVDTNWYLIKGEEPLKNCKDDMVDFGKKLVKITLNPLAP